MIRVRVCATGAIWRTPTWPTWRRGEGQRPKVEKYPDQDQVLLVWYGARPGTAERPTLLWEVDLVAGENYLITSHGGGPIDPTPFARRVKARRELASEGAGYLLYVALDEIVDTFFPALDTLSDRLVELEEKVLAGETDVQGRILAIRKELIEARRIIGPMRDAMVILLRRDLGLFSVVTMISGIYGMNFHHMPELAWRFGYAWALGLMVVTATALWIYFKRKGWL
jgi:Mg2+ and Co2+ transporter CorA